MAVEARRPSEIADRSSIEANRTRMESERAAERVGEAVQATTAVSERLLEQGQQVSERVLEQGQQMMMLSLRAFSALNDPAARIGLEQTRRAAETAAHVAALYREAAERSSDDVQALIASCAHAGRGLQQWQHACFDLAQHWVKRYADRRGDVVHARSPVELATAQRDLYLDAVGSVFTANTSLLQLAGRIVEDAVRPLQERARLTARA